MTSLVKKIAVLALVASFAIPVNATPAKTGAASTTATKKTVEKCTTILNPEIVCPAGQTLATRGNSCHTDLVPRRVCKKVAA